MLPHSFCLPPLPFEMILHLKVAAVKEKRNTESKKQAVFKRIFKSDIVHVCFKPYHDRRKNYDF